ncbi:DEAD-domain-containing protein [Exidia glandulosa HHB12029]|uniref:DEAD-domain-containing protein n=1 Tax=Exidia glandulosa HHB12029 TaxID=1314781 RepID=A0A165LBS6_EXIGL|nr:DEAD-domain-containing protein [Exidia glandulosa HHB12029]
MSDAEPTASTSATTLDDVPDGEKIPSFKELGVIQPLLEALEKLSFTRPTEIQAAVLPHALADHDIIGVAETGSGKTAAFALPILQKLWAEPAKPFALVLAPTRELAFQIAQTFEALGGALGVRVCTIIGGVKEVEQQIALAKQPHIIVAAPGRLNWHLENTKGFSLRKLQYLVMDEADRLLDLDFGKDIDKLLKLLPKERRTYLFSATMTDKVEKLQRASLSNPKRIAVNSKYSTVSTLLQYYLFIPLVQKEVHLIHLANSLAEKSIIIFTRTQHDAQRFSIILRTLGFSAIPLHGALSQSARLGALSKFKAGGRKILVATDVASRGLDIPHVDIVINYDVPTNSKDYIHRVGRTARAGRAGKSITFVTQYDVEVFKRTEAVIGKEMEQWAVEKEEVEVLRQRVEEAARVAAKELRDAAEGGKDGRGRKKRRRDVGGGGADDRDRDDDEVEAGMPMRRKKHKGR